MALDVHPLLDASLAIRIHVATVAPAALIGALQFAFPKGTSIHRSMGYGFIVLMLVTSIAAFFIPSFMGTRFSFIHLFILVTVFGCLRAMHAIRTGDVRAHAWSLAGVYVGAIGIAGYFAFQPGRIMHDVLFGG